MPLLKWHDKQKIVDLTSRNEMKHLWILILYCFFLNISLAIEKHISLIFKLNRLLEVYIKGTFLDNLMHSSINSKQMTHTFKLSLRQNSKESQL